jgi:hypothetical protein
MKFSLLILIFITFANFIFAQPSDLVGIDFRKLVSNADLIYQEPVTRSEAGQPIGNGRMGSLVWTIPSQIKLQINRVDVFANNSSTNNFYERNTDYCGGVGYVDFDFGNEVFTSPDFRQHLSCYDGLTTVHGKSVNAEFFVWNEQDVMVARIHDQRVDPSSILINLRMLRMPESKMGNHKAISKISIEKGYIVLSQEFKEDSYYCGSAVVIGTSTNNVRGEIADESTVRLVAKGGGSKFSVFIASAASFNPEDNLIEEAITKLEKAKTDGFDRLYQSNQQWWSNFWQKSFIRLNSKDGVANFIEQNYTYYLYVMASSSRGSYPTKFNGMLWTTGGDRRQWGGAFWGANQSCLYTALFPTNHLELMDPMFNMYSSAYKTFETAARQQWGSKGIYIPETLGFDGVPELPDDIADEMRSLYLLQKPWDQRSQRFMDFAETKLPFLSRWNWKYTGEWKEGRFAYKERGDGPYGPVNHIFSRGAKMAYQYWQKYEYTGDLTWLKEQAYPMLKGVAEFYRNYPNVKKEKDGKYHIYHVNDNESIWGGHNTVEEISSMMGIFPVVIKASEILNVDAEMRPVWSEFIKNLAPLPTSEDYPSLKKDPKIWVGSLQPTSPVRGNGQRHPDGNTMPVWFFDLCNMDADPEMLKLANATYDTYFQNGINKDVFPYVLSKVPAAGAVLGRVDATRFLIPNQLRRDPKHEVLANRMDISEGFYTTNIQRLGRAADALHLALCQSSPASPGKDPIIRVFPAWPTEWDAQFSLLCRGNFIVTSSMNNGSIEFVGIKSQSGRICRIHNPWGNETMDIYKDKKKIASTREKIVVLETKANENFILVRKGHKLSQFRQN